MKTSPQIVEDATLPRVGPIALAVRYLIGLAIIAAPIYWAYSQEWAAAGPNPDAQRWSYLVLGVFLALGIVEQTRLQAAKMRGRASRSGRILNLIGYGGAFVLWLIPPATAPLTVSSAPSNSWGILLWGIATVALLTLMAGVYGYFLSRRLVAYLDHPR